MNTFEVRSLEGDFGGEFETEADAYEAAAEKADEWQQNAFVFSPSGETLGWIEPSA